MNTIQIFVSFCVLALCNFIGSGTGEADPCHPYSLTSEMQAKWDVAYDKCSNTTGLKNGPHLPDRKTALEDVKIDDKCYQQCMYKELGAAIDDSGIKKDGTEIIFKSNMTAEDIGKSDKIWNSCIDDSAKILKSRGDENKCSIFLLHTVCWSKKTAEEKVMQKC